MKITDPKKPNNTNFFKPQVNQSEPKKQDKVPLKFEGTATTTMKPKRQTKTNKMTISLADTHADQLKLYAQQHNTTPTATIEYLIEKYFTHYKLTRGRFPLMEPVTIEIPTHPKIISEYMKQKINLIVHTDNNPQGQKYNQVSIFDPQHNIIQSNRENFTIYTLHESNNYFDTLDPLTKLYYTPEFSHLEDKYTHHTGLIPILITEETEEENTDIVEYYKKLKNIDIQHFTINGSKTTLIFLLVEMYGENVETINIISSKMTFKMLEHSNPELYQALEWFLYHTAEVERINQKVTPYIELENKYNNEIRRTQQLEEENKTLYKTNSQLNKLLKDYQEEPKPGENTREDTEIKQKLESYKLQLKIMEHKYTETLHALQKLTFNLLDNTDTLYELKETQQREDTDPKK